MSSPNCFQIRQRHLLVLFTVIMVGMSACKGSKKESIQKPVKEHKANNTAISDEAYYFFALDDLDTMEGFDRLLAMEENVAFVETSYKELVDKGDKKNFNVQDLTFLVLGNIRIRLNLRNNIRMSQKDSILHFGLYRNTLNTVELRLRKNKTFDIHDRIMWEDLLYEGTYELNNDTLRLKYFGEGPDNVQSTMILTEERIKPVDSLGRYVTFYLQEKKIAP